MKTKAHRIKKRCLPLGDKNMCDKHSTCVTSRREYPVVLFVIVHMRIFVLENPACWHSSSVTSYQLHGHVQLS